jgi:hypothetical protein
MATQGPLYGGLAVNNTGIGTVAWGLSPTGTTALANDSAATVAASSIVSNQITNFLVIRSEGFTIPSGATINGITVSTRLETVGALPTAFNVKLWNGTSTTVNNSIGTQKALTPTGTFAVYTLGSTSDVWGATLTDTIVNGAGFGVALWVTASASASSDIPIVDYVSITVTYTVNAVTQSAVIMCGM